MISPGGHEAEASRRAGQRAVGTGRVTVNRGHLAAHVRGLLHPARVLYLDELVAKHSRSAIVNKLRDYTKRHVDFAQLDDLDERIGRDAASWYRQGGQLLDAADRPREVMLKLVK